MSNSDRIVRVVLAALFSCLYFSEIITGALGIVLVTLGGVFLLTAIFAFCPLYAPSKFTASTQMSLAAGSKGAPPAPLVAEQFHRRVHACN